MEMTSPGVNPNAYGKDAGYSEDYGMQETPMQPVLQEETAYNTTNNGDQQQQQAGGAPMNPFTQKQYQAASTNPFNR